MATFLDATFIGNFSILFTFLFVYVLVYGIAEFSKPFGKDKRNLNALVALGVAVLLVISPTMVRLVNFMIPWFFIIALVMFFILFSLRVFGGESVDFKAAATDKRVYTWIIVLTIVIMIFGLGNAFGQSSLESGNWEGTAEVNPDPGYDVVEDPVTLDDDIDPSGLRNDGVDGAKVATDDFSTNLMNTIFNPKVLGLILIMLVAVFAMFFISD